MSKIVLEHIDKYYGNSHVLKDINLTIEDGDFMTLLGPSGCGKTTTLRVVSGLERPQHAVEQEQRQDQHGQYRVHAPHASTSPTDWSTSITRTPSRPYTVSAR